MHSILRDIRYGARSLRKSPGLSIIAVFALTLGIGLTTTMFSIVYGALMNGLPFPNADRIVVVAQNNVARGWERMSASIHDYRDFTEQQHSFSILAAFYGGTVNVSGTEKADRYDGSFVTANTFDIAQVKPLIGRTFRPGEDEPGGERVAVLGYAMWKDRYGGDPNILGRPIRANGVPFTVIGVMPEKFAFPNDAKIWLPLQLDPLKLKRGDGQHLDMLGVLKPGVSLDAANADLSVIARRLQTEYKETNEGIGVSAMTFNRGQLGPQPIKLLYTMLGAVFCVLLIACANVANLLLDRAAHKTKEVGIRTALGASRSAVIRQFLTEAFVLAIAGAAFGVTAAHFGIAAFNRAIADTDPPYWLDIRLHAPVLLFAIVVALLATIVSGAIPAYQSSRADINEILKDESRGASSFRIGRLSKTLVIFEIALSCGLLVAAGLMIKTVVKLRNVDPGFVTKNVFTARIGFPETYTDTNEQRQFYTALQERLAARPGVQSVSVSAGLPGVNSGGSSFAVEGKSYAKDGDYPQTRTNAVAPGFFETFGLRALQGRTITAQDRAEALPVAVVNQAFVTKFFAGEDPIGKRIRLGNSHSKAPWLSIVGVAPTTFSTDPEDPRPAAVYSSLAQDHSNFVSIAVRTTRAPMTLTPQVREVVSSLNQDIPIYWVYSMEEALARPLWFIRVFGTMFMIFGFIALFLASVGLYAVMAFSVSRRTREVGIRMALGAQTTHVVSMILRQGLLQLGLGMGFGIALALGVSQLMQFVLIEVQPRDPVVFLSVVATLTVTGMLACLFPAHRATRVDPLAALRSD